MIVAVRPGWWPVCAGLVMRGWLMMAQIEGLTGWSDSLYVIKPGSQDAMFAELFGAYERAGALARIYVGHRLTQALKLDLVALGRRAIHYSECLLD